MLKWDPVYGPVRDRGAGDRSLSGGRQDRAGSNLVLAPTIWRQVGQCVVGQSPETRVGQRFDERTRYSGRARVDVQFSEDARAHRVMHDAILDGLDSPGECTGWLMSCYEVMRERGRWPVNVPIEQLLADEEVFMQLGEIQPPCPASIQ